jgi:HEPN domain-containing protein
MAACDEARRLLAKAGEDEYVVDRLLEHVAAPEAMVGFHAQQAAEKLLKAALFLAAAVPPRTHNLTQLMDLAAASGLQLPVECEALRWLTPYAVLYRYEGEAEADEELLAREAVRENLRRLRAWVELLLEKCEASEQG